MLMATMFEVLSSSTLPKEMEKENIPIHSFPNPKPNSQLKNISEVEIQLFRKGKQVCIFGSKLGGWERNRLEVQDILDDHKLKSLYTFNPITGVRGNLIRFSSIDGRSFDQYSDGAVIFVDGDSKEGLTTGRVAVTAMVVAVALMVVIGVVLVQCPKWIGTWRLGNGKIPPWIIACLVIVFTVVRNRGKNRAGVHGERNKEHIL